MVNDFGASNAAILWIKRRRKSSKKVPNSNHVGEKKSLLNLAPLVRN